MSTLHISNTLQHTATHCNTLHMQSNKTCQRYIFLTHCCTLQHTATYCNILQHTATHCTHNQAKHCQCYMLSFFLLLAETRGNTLQHTPKDETRCNILQHAATRKRTDLQQQGVRAYTRRVVMALLVVAAQILFRGAVVCIL